MGTHDPMGIGMSIFLIAFGAILAFAVNAEVGGLEIETVGIILLIVGVVLALLGRSGRAVGGRNHWY